MKILLATDGSESAKHAEALVDSIVWPAGTEIEALCVDQLVGSEIDLPPRRLAAAHAALRQEIDDHLAALVQQLSRPGRTVRARVIFGRPASTITNEATQLGSELVIIGSHDRGALASFALGSVAAEVVDQTTCPVLVARRSTLGPIVLGHDGSDGARHAEELVATWPFLARETVRIVSVSPLLPSWYASADAGMSPGVSGEFLQELLDERRAESTRIADAAAARLVERGLQATADIRDGTPAEGILDAIATAKADLVVVGSRGNKGVTRLLLGSVARTVLHDARCSVLIVRQPVRATSADTAPAAVVAL